MQSALSISVYIPAVHYKHEKLQHRNKEQRVTRDNVQMKQKEIELQILKILTERKVGKTCVSREAITAC